MDKTLIESAFENRHSLTPTDVDPTLKIAVQEIIQALDHGRIRVCEKVNDQWRVNEWIKKAILLYFRLHPNQLMNGSSPAYDKIPLKFENFKASDFEALKIRVVPPATVRLGAYVAPDCILMPSYINLGAYVGKGTMVDTWATVGSCAQIGEHVHLSGGVGIGGVLEPLQAQPTIIEDHCFIGARSEVVEGVIIGEGSVLSMGVFIGQSTRIYDRTTGAVLQGRVPPYSVVVPGTLPSADGSHQLYAAIIVKKVDAQTRSKVGLNELLRDSLAEHP